jgi:hypothetical protein
VTSFVMSWKKRLSEYVEVRKLILRIELVTGNI